MVAFASNSLICRAAFQNTTVHPVAFTAIRLLSGAVVLGVLVASRKRALRRTGSWGSALALFAYAICFSLAYVTLSTGTGALILFGSVQFTMITVGIASGERLTAGQWTAFLMAVGSMVWLVLPGVASPPLLGAALMSVSGIGWGVYSLRGRGVADPLVASAGNFLKATIPGAVAFLVLPAAWKLDTTGVALAALSGGVTSGIGYVIWYAAVRHLQATTAATVQLSVPVIAGVAAVGILDEPLTVRLVVASVGVLGGIAGVILLSKKP